MADNIQQSVEVNKSHEKDKEKTLKGLKQLCTLSERADVSFRKNIFDLKKVLTMFSALLFIKERRLKALGVKKHRVIRPKQPLTGQERESLTPYK